MDGKTCLKTLARFAAETQPPDGSQEVKVDTSDLSNDSVIERLINTALDSDATDDYKRQIIRVLLRNNSTPGCTYKRMLAECQKYAEKLGKEYHVHHEPDLATTIGLLLDSWSDLQKGNQCEQAVKLVVALSHNLYYAPKHEVPFSKGTCQELNGRFLTKKK